MIDGWDFGLVTLSVTDPDDGFIGLQLDLPGEKNAGCPTGEVVGSYGLLARPHDPELDEDGEPKPSKACSALWTFYGSRHHVWPQHDPRVIAKLPKLKKGGAIVYGGKLGQAAFLEIDGDTGSLTGYFPYDFEGAGENATPRKAHGITADVRTAGAESIGLVHGAGMSFTMLAGGKNVGQWKNKNGTVFAAVDDDMFMTSGPTVLGAPTGAKALAIAEAVVAALNTLKQACLAASGDPASAPALTQAALLPLTLQLEAIATQLLKGA